MGGGDGVFVGHDVRAVAVGVGPGHLRAQQQDLRRVVDPDQQHRQRAGGAEGGGHAGAPDVEGDEVFAQVKQHRGDQRAEPDVLPGNLGVGQPLEQQGEEQRDHADRDHVVEQVPERHPLWAGRSQPSSRTPRALRSAPARPAAESRGVSTSASARMRARRKRFTPPPGLGSTFQTVLRASCSSTITPVAPTSRVTMPDHGGPDAPLVLAGLQHRRLHHLGGVGAQQARQLPDDLALGGLAAQEDPRHRDDHDQHRRQREDRVVGERGPQPWALVRAPLAEGLFQDWPHLPPDAPHACGAHQAPCHVAGAACALRAGGAVTPA